ncbi:helix-turn-helix domain-containing protein [Lentisphaera profundi]|uniref:Helix-turn-helix domain-containing protein n=1 Tax=Lentisphaera profundi TaxID=1658616 RepID=A0ABY7VUQ9_9BACT|nr:helix-turn-helix domain-containing protein [Lentisphaera profundi]WDE97636.1 helix-turn-helix domain-containing protein [Lentisphaera profundi]
MNTLQEDFLKRLGNHNRLDLLLSQSMGVYFFIKDTAGRVMMANKLTYVRCGFKSEDEIIGKTDYDLFEFDLADKYHKDEQAIIQKGEAVFHMAELAPNKDGIIDCYFSNKMPVHDLEGNIIGVASTTSSHDYMKKMLGGYLTISPALEFVRDNFRTNISIPELAESLNMTQRKFGEIFKEVLTVTPQTYIIKMRIHYACVDLINTKKALKKIAEDVGFYDHSTFIRQFSKHVGMLPTKYRNSHKK